MWTMILLWFAGRRRTLGLNKSPRASCCSLFLELSVWGVLTDRDMPAALSSPPASIPASALRQQREFERECIQLFSEVVQVLGVPRSVGQIYGLLFASSQPLSFSDIVERLEISKGSASQGLQLLRALGAIKPVAVEDGQSDEQAVGKARGYYEPELSLRKLVSGVLQERIVPMTTTGSDHFARLRLLAEESGKQNNFLIERVEQLETWRKRFRTVLPILSALFGPKKQ